MQIMGPSLRTEPATPTDPCGINATPRFAFLSFHTARPTSTISKTLQSKRTTAGVPCPTRRLRLPTHSTSFVTQTNCSSSVTPMTRPRPSDSVRAIIESAIPNTRVEGVSIIHTKRLLKTFKIELVDERALLLNLPPPSSRLLRSEQWLLQSEAAVVGWLLDDVYRQNEGARCLNEKSAENPPQGEGSLKRWTSHLASDTSSPPGGQLVDYLPTLIKHSPTSSEIGPAYNLWELTPGDPISSLEEPLTRVEQRSVNFQKGRLMRRIANVASPNGRFGPPVTVLGQPPTLEKTQRTTRDTKLDFDGADSWRTTFHLLLEGILRDGEDLAVTMSYELVRATFHKFGHLLDAVTTPRLVVYDLDEDDVVLVSRPKKTTKQRKQEETESPKLSPKVKIEYDSSGEDLVDEGSSSTIRVTGLRDWSNCIFGDPLFATVFSHPSPEFEHGFQRQPHEESDVVKKKRARLVATTTNNKTQRIS